MSIKINDVDYMTMEEVSDASGLAYETVRKYKRTEGMIPSPKRILGKPMWSREEIEEWIKDRETVEID